jgi:hypothetical protein
MSCLGCAADKNLIDVEESSYGQDDASAREYDSNCGGVSTSWLRKGIRN